MRIELLHLRAGGTERFEPTRLRAERIWAGPEQPARDLPEWGDYRISISEPGTQTILYRQGFDSPAAATGASAARLALRIPWPRRAVRAAIEARRSDHAFEPMWNSTIDPDTAEIDRSPPAIPARVETIVENGPPATQVDIAILGDGYTEAEQAKFVADAKRATGYLFSVEPFQGRMREFSVRAAFTASAASGVTDPYLGLVKASALGASYGQGEAERTLFAANVHALYEAASAVPHDVVLVLANARRYGGSAHFGGPAVVAIDSALARYLVVHEFAHAIAGLADEYYVPAAGGPVYGGQSEPWQPNVTASAAAAKWRAPSGTLAPLPWNKVEYERYFADYVKRYLALREARAAEDVIEAFLEEAGRRQAALLAKSGLARTIGLVEGAHGHSRGLYRAEANCIMFSLQSDYFCAACHAAIERMIEAHSR